MAADTARPLESLPFSFAGPIAVTRLSWAYRFGLLVVVLVLLLLPLAYLAVIALAGAGVWWHVTRHIGWLQDTDSNIQWRALAYGAPALAGMVVTFFMIKPLFAGRRGVHEPLALEARDHPQLFALIEEICRLVHAPIPTRVLVDCQVNASASFAPGWRSVIRRDLLLTIGLPLVYALSVRELAGVLAHEFGHFAQGSGLRLTMVVRGINWWFARVVHERDAWDWRLDQWSKSGDVRWILMLLPSRAGVWVSRQVLRRLMWGGHMISCFMTRQMEYDADSYEVKIAGSDAFAATMRRLRELDFAALHASTYINRELAAQRLPKDLPLFFVEWLHLRASRVLGALDEAAPKRGLFNTHPSDDDRVSAAARAEDPGVLLGGQEPALGLFVDFEALSQAATRRHYEHSGLLKGVDLVDAVDSVRLSWQREERRQALATMFDLGVARFRPLKVPALAREAAPVAQFQAWRFPDALERFDERVKQRVAAFVAQEVIHSEYGVFDPAPFGLSEWTLDAAMAAEHEALDKIDVLSKIIEPYERVKLHRVALGIDRLARSGDASYPAARLHGLVEALNTAAMALEVAFEFRRLHEAHTMLDQLVPTSPSPDATSARRDRLAPLVAESMTRLREIVAGAPCPALPGGKAATLAEACKLEGSDDSLLPATIALEDVYSTLLREVCWLALRGEGR
jgi:Zn-dependent protease with chaperone function